MVTKFYFSSVFWICQSFPSTGTKWALLEEAAVVYSLWKKSYHQSGSEAGCTYKYIDHLHIVILEQNLLTRAQAAASVRCEDL